MKFSDGKVITRNDHYHHYDSDDFSVRSDGITGTRLIFRFSTVVEAA